MKTKIRPILMGIVLSLWAGAAFAQDAVVLVTGTQAGSARLFNDKNGSSSKIYAPVVTDKGAVITVPEAEVGDMMYLVNGVRSTWISPAAGGTVTVDMSDSGWKYGGPRSELNSFLDRWTQDFYMGRPNELAVSFHMQKFAIDKRFRQPGAPESYFTPEYRKWMRDSRRRTAKEFDRLKADDRALFARIRKTLDYMWVEMWQMNYVMHKTVMGEPPADAVVEISLDDPQILDYPGGDNIMRYYFMMLDDAGAINAPWAEDLAAKASMIKNPQVREHYVLSELDMQINRGKYLYGTDRILESVRDMMVTDRGRAKYGALAEAYRKMAENTGDGLPIYPFELEGLDRKTVKPGDFAGKYLFIDIWATWCGPCKAEIPHLIELEKKMAGRNIEFLSISVDKSADREKWVETVDLMKMGGRHAISPNTTNYEMFRHYGITAIPRFMLVAPDGTLIMSRARRPSDPILLKQLNELTEPLR